MYATKLIERLSLMGAVRSPLVVATWLRERRGIPLSEAYKLISSRWPVVTEMAFDAGGHEIHSVARPCPGNRGAAGVFTSACGTKHAIPGTSAGHDGVFLEGSLTAPRYSQQLQSRAAARPWPAPV